MTKTIMNTLKFITAGNVDDGKSTLIGRLLYDSDSIHTDQLGVLKAQTKLADTEIDLALITDGLRAEREQGITIDVAYKYFSTSKRKFIIADAPGHEQYTRNMITGASNSDLIIILIDARKGITAQTRRHASIASLIGIKKAVVAINKIDLVGYSEAIFEQIKSDFETLKEQLAFEEVVYIPVSALNGDNVVESSTATPWYTGDSLLRILEHIEISGKENLSSRFQVQWVIRPGEEAYHDYRGYAGYVQSGTFSANDAVTVYPSGIETTITRIEKYPQVIETAEAGENIVIHLADNIDISRGDSIVKTAELPSSGNEFKTWICWLSTTPLQVGKPYLLQHKSRTVRAKIQSADKLWNVNDWEFQEVNTLKLNDIAQVSLRTNQPLFYDAFEDNSETGSAILIDETSFDTVAALMFLKQEVLQEDDF